MKNLVTTEVKNLIIQTEIALANTANGVFCFNHVRLFEKFLFQSQLVVPNSSNDLYSRIFVYDIFGQKFKSGTFLVKIKLFSFLIFEFLFNDLDLTNCF